MTAFLLPSRLSLLSGCQVPWLRHLQGTGNSLGGTTSTGQSQ